MDSAHEQPPAIEDLLQHAAFVRNLARGLVRGEDRVDDVVQQSYLRALKSPPRHGANLRSWLAVVVRNVVYRDAHRRRAAEDAAWRSAQDAEGGEAADVAAERSDFQLSLSRAVHDLPEPFRTVIVLRFFDELSIDEVAERLGVPRETVRSRQRRGLARLRGQLTREDESSGRDWHAVALAWIGEEAPAQAGTVGTSFAGGWLAALAVLLPLAALGGAWWWVERDARPDAEDLALDVPTDTSVAGGTRADEVAPATEREALGAIGASDTRLAVRGVVLALEDDVPLPGARVVVSGVVRGERLGAVLVADARGVVEGELRAGATIPAEDDLAVLGDTAPRWFAVARAPGRATVRRFPLAIDEARRRTGPVELGTLHLAVGAPVSLRVVDHASGNGVANARVWFSDDAPEVASLQRAVPVGRTGLDGRFTFEGGIAPNQHPPYTWSLFATHEGRIGWCDVPLDPAGGALQVELPMGPYASLDARVVDEDGSPAVGATVTLLPRHFPYRPTSPEDREVVLTPELARLFRAETDAAGRARFAALPGRDDSMSALRPPGSDERWMGGPFAVTVRTREGRVYRLPEIALPIDAHSERELRLDAAHATRRGRVLAARDDAPLSDAWVRDVATGVRYEADARGEFFPGAGASGELEVGAPGFLTATVTWDAEASGLLVCRLHPAFRIVGSVSDVDGVPLAGVGVLVQGGRVDQDWGVGARTRSLRATTDARGAFRFDDLEDGAWSLTLEPAAGSPWAVPAPRFVVAGEEHLDLTLHADERARRDVVVRTVDAESGEEVPALDAELSRLDADPAARPTLRTRGARVELDAVPVGRWRLWVRVPGRGACSLDFAVEAADRAAPLELRLACAGPARIEGVVERPGAAGSTDGWIVASVFQGPGPPDRWPSLRREYGSRAMRSYVEEDGRYAMDTVVPGPYRLELIAPGWTATTTLVVPPGGRVVQDLRARLAGTLVLRGSGAVPDGLSILVDEGAGGGRWHWLDAEVSASGWEARRSVPPGDRLWSLGVRRPPGSRKPLPPERELAGGTVAVTSGDEVVVEVRLGGG